MDSAAVNIGEQWLGFAPPAVIGVGMLLLGVILLYAWRLYKRERFSKRRLEVADPKILEAPAIAGCSM